MAHISDFDEKLKMALDRWQQFEKDYAINDGNAISSKNPVNSEQDSAADKVTSWFDKIDEHNCYPIEEVANVDDILNRLLCKSIDYSAFKNNFVMTKMNFSVLFTENQSGSCGF